jgi:hypothetical protein
MSSDIDTGDLINFSNSPPHTPITSRSTSFTQPTTNNNIPYEDKWPTLQPKQISMWSSNNWAPITAQPRAVDQQFKVKDQAELNGVQAVDPPQLRKTQVVIEEKTVDRGKGKDKEPPTSSTTDLPKSNPATASKEDQLSSSSVNRPSPLQLKNTNHITSPSISIESRKNIPLPASPYTSSNLNSGKADSPSSFNSGKNIPLPASPYTSSSLNSGKSTSYSPSITSGKNIPLPASPYTTESVKLESPSNHSGKNIPLPPSNYSKTDSDAQSTHSFNSDETTQSRLSATAKPFTATPQKRIDVIRKSDPPSFFSPKESTEWKHDHTLSSNRSGSDVSADQMDPAYYDPGYGGRPNLISAASRPRSPTWFARPQSRVISISSPVASTKKTDEKEKHEGIRPSTPITSSKVYDGTVSPVSNRDMREVTPMSPSQESSDDDPELCKLDDISFADDEPNSPSELWLGEVDVDAGHISEPIERITAHLSSISLSPSERSFNTSPNTVPPHPSSEANSAKSAYPDPYIRARHGRLTPELDQGGDKDKQDNEQFDRSSEEDIGLDTTLVSEGLFDFSNSLDELDEIENAWLQFRDGYGAFSGSIDEALARLKREMNW